MAAQALSERAYKLWNAQRGLYALAPTVAAARVEVIDAKTVVSERVVSVAARVVGVTHGGTRWLGGVSGALDWLDGRGARSGWWVAGADGVWWRRCPLDVLSESMLIFVDTELQRADHTARQACRIVGEARLPIALRCPACRRRSLQLHHEGAERSWFVQCVSARCRCAGTGCGCLQRRRIEGRRHAWSRAELDGPYGLRMAVAMAGRLKGAS
jgi:hypothetical protein